MIRTQNALQLLCSLMAFAAACAEIDAPLPEGVKAVWDIEKAFHEKTATRGRVCLNGLWRWQPARTAKGIATPENSIAADVPLPEGAWGFFKVPGCWPGIGDYMQKDSQTVIAHPSWKDAKLREINAAWHQREFSVPQDWAGRRITIYTEYLNSGAVVYVDGKKAGTMEFPAGEVDVTALVKPGAKHVLSMLVIAAPLSDIMLLFSDTNTRPQDAKKTKARVDRRGLCGDVFLVSEPAAARIGDARVVTSVRNGEIKLDVAVNALAVDDSYSLQATIKDGDKTVHEFKSAPFTQNDFKEGRVSLASRWKAEKLWDIHTPRNLYYLELSLLDAGGKTLDTALPQRFGFREFWIDGRDFYLNGSRIFLSCIPIDNAAVGSSACTYAAARESFERMKSFGINFVYSHNFGCEPGAHLGFADILRAADDTGVLFSLTQPHFGQYDWKAVDADARNGYARHASFYTQMAGNHPSVVFYSMSHNATGYNEDMDPNLIDGKYERRAPWSKSGAERAQRAEKIVSRLDPTRIVYHHSSGNLGSMHNMNFYPNFTPVQELCDWFEHWSKDGIKPLFMCEYGAPFSWDWTMYRGWYWNDKHQWVREFGSARAAWEFCMAEWNAQFFGDKAFQISDVERNNLRWEAQQMKAGKPWFRWDYPAEVGSRRFNERYPVLEKYFTDNFRAYRTLGVSAISPWEHHYYWKTREGFARKRNNLATDWENLQQPGFSPDFIDDVYDSYLTAYERADWVTTPASEALIRNNRPPLAYIGGPAAHVTSKEHNYFISEAVEKQLVIINNSREAVECECDLNLEVLSDGHFLHLILPGQFVHPKKVTLRTGEQARVPFQIALAGEPLGKTYEIKSTVKFSNGETQTDTFPIHVLPDPRPPKTDAKIAIFDPKGETTKLLDTLPVTYQSVNANANLAIFDTLIVGKGALTLDGAAPDISRVRDGLKVILFEQTSAVLEKRFGFRVTEYGLRNVFKRVPDSPALNGLSDDNLRDWRGSATLLPGKLATQSNDQKFNGAPYVKWCDIDVTRIWRAGCRGNVASVLIEKPARGNFLPLIDGGFSLQYSPLLEYREGKGVVVFCQMDVTGRTEVEPAAEILTRNLLNYVAAWKAQPQRRVLYTGEAEGLAHLQKAGVAAEAYVGGALAADQVLIAGPGSGAKLGAAAGLVGEWLKNGGHVLAVGLDESEANAFLPEKVKMKKAEHIAAYFNSAGNASALAGVGPADVHNRDPRPVPLLASGAIAIGNGILGKSENECVVFCQLAPWQFKYTVPQNTKRTFRRVSCLMTRLLGNLCVSATTPLLDRFHSPVDVAKAEKRWLEGFYLDQPEEWDDPYRFFRW